MSSFRLSVRPLWFGAAPLALIAFFLVAGVRADRSGPAAPSPPPAGPPAHGSGRLVVVILDSLRRATVEEPGLMPNLLALSRRAGTSVLDVHTCASNFSLPCIQTIFSGRESPMAAGVEEFVGYGAARRNLAEQAASAGLKVGVVGNEMLSTLYGRHARTGFSVAPLNLDPLSEDLAAIGQAEAVLEGHAIDVLVLHTAGTDHVAHYQLPGSAGYRRHFRTVDTALVSLLRRLDLRTDALVVLGDHGHDQRGNHVRHSVAIFAGRPFEELFPHIDVPTGGIEQKDLLYLLSYPLMLPLPTGYEGRFFAVRPGAGERLTAFVALQRRVLETAGMPPAGAAARMEPDWREGNEKARENLFAALPLLLCLLLWVAWTYARVRQVRSSPWIPSLVVAFLALVVWLAGRVWLVSPALLSAAPLVGIGWIAGRRRSRPLLLVVGLLVAAAALTAAIEPGWRSFFHSRDEFHWGIPIFYLVMLGTGALVAAVRGGGVKSWPWATQLAAFVALPAGVYYYQFDENPLRAYLIPAAVLATAHLLGSVRRRPAAGHAVRPASERWGLPRIRRASAVLLLVLTALLLVPQDAGGWQWHPWLAVKLAGTPAWLPVIAYLLGAAWLLALLEPWRARLPMAALLLATPVYTVSFAQAGSDRLMAAFVVVLFACSWIVVGSRLAAPGRANAHPSSAPGGPAAWAGTRWEDEMTGLMLAAAAVAIVLAMCDGFVLEHVDFTFALPFTTGLRTDGGRFVVAAPLVALKYGSPILVLLACHRLLRGSAAAARASAFMLLFLTLKLLALLAQSLIGALDTGEKFFELAQADFVFVAGLVIVASLWIALIAAADALVAALGWSGLGARQPVAESDVAVAP